MTTPLAERFDRRVLRTPTCWMWFGAANPGGYGRLMLDDGRIGYAHRVSYELHHGPIPDGLQVLHRCDVPCCVNPDHLFVGTHADNMADRHAKGRTRTGVTLGTDHWAHRFTEDEIRDVRARLAAGESQLSVARAYGVTHSSIWNIAHRKTWRHVA